MSGSTDPVGDLTSQGSGYVIRGGSANTRDVNSETTHFRGDVGPNDNLRKAGFRPVWPLSSRR